MFTFGGGLAMLPLMEKELADKNKWTTRDQLLDYYAIAQITPGIIAVNVATFLGYNLAGIIGGVFATFGVVTPSIIIISAIAYFIDYYSQIEWVQSALKGINVAVCSLMSVTLYRFIKQGLKACNVVVALILMILSFVLIAFFNVPSSLVIIGGALVGVIIYVIINKRMMKK